MSDAQPTRRNLDEKRRQLAELREVFASMKPHVTASLRASVTGKISALEAELGLSATVHIRTQIRTSATGDAGRQPATQSRPMTARPVAARTAPVRPTSQHQAQKTQTAMGGAFDTARQRRLAEANAVFAKLG